MKNVLLSFMLLLFVSCSINRNSIEGNWKITGLSTNDSKQINSAEANAALLFLNYQLEGSSFYFDKNKVFSILDKEGKTLVEGNYDNSHKNLLKLSSKEGQMIYKMEEKNKDIILLTDSAQMVLEISRK